MVVGTGGAWKLACKAATAATRAEKSVCETNCGNRMEGAVKASGGVALSRIDCIPVRLKLRGLRMRRTSWRHCQEASLEDAWARLQTTADCAEK